MEWMVWFSKERRVSKLQGTYNLPYYRIGRVLATLRTWYIVGAKKMRRLKGCLRLLTSVAYVTLLGCGKGGFEMCCVGRGGFEPPKLPK